MRTATFLALAVTLRAGTRVRKRRRCPARLRTRRRPRPPRRTRSPGPSTPRSTPTSGRTAGTTRSPRSRADRGWLHLEARVNYEDLDTGSAGSATRSASARRSRSNSRPWSVFGNTNGVAPGYKGSLAWRAVELSRETQYVFDVGDSADNFLHTGSELAVAPVDWCRVGMTVQRTKVYQTAFDIQRGFLVGISYKRAATRWKKVLGP